VNNGIYNEVFKENEINNDINKLHRCDTSQSDNIKRSIDFERMSVGTIGTYGTDLTRPYNIDTSNEYKNMNMMNTLILIILPIYIIT
jgi:hypothetical protein